MGCPCDVNNPAQYLTCAGDTVRLIAPQSVMTTFAAQAGASSANYTMCLAMMFLSARRMEYWKVSPGDCGSPGTAVLGSTPVIEKSVLGGLQAGASIDPEPISKGILAGVAAIFGGFVAHHAQAVATEQQTLCGVTNGFNYLMQQLENAVSQGQIDAVTAAGILENGFQQLNPNLNAIKSGQNAAWGYQIAMTALKNFAEQIVFPALQSLAQGNVPAVAAPPPSYPTSPAYIPPPSNPTAVLSVGVGGFQGQSGYVPAPMTGQNVGIGFTASNLPFSITPGEIILIGGVAFVASRL